MPNIYVFHGHPDAQMHEAVVQYIEKTWETRKSADGYVTQNKRGSWVIDKDAKHTSPPNFDQRHRGVKLLFLTDVHNILSLSTDDKIDEFQRMFSKNIVVIFNTLPISAQAAVFWGRLAHHQVTFGVPDTETQKQTFIDAFASIRKDNYPGLPVVALTDEDYDFLVECADHCHQREIIGFCANVMREARFGKITEITRKFIEDNFMYRTQINHNYPSITSRIGIDEQRKYEQIQTPQYKKLKLQ